MADIQFENKNDDSEEGLTKEQAEEAMQEGDMVSFDELTERHPNLRGEQIDVEVAKFQDAGPPVLSKIIHPKHNTNKIIKIKSQCTKSQEKQQDKDVKHIIQDQRELKMRARRHQEALAREKKMYMKVDSGQYVKPFQLLQQPAVKNKESARKDFFSDKKEANANKDEEDEEDDDDEEAMLAYKMEKMKILDEHAPNFGTMNEVTAWTFESEVYKAPPKLLVIVSVFQDVMLSWCLSF
ncbi:hypothetical protein RFI_38850 [Reticulomyxa filosa]|uniref:Uncharacterized protein n=1 Tax=Reticulomyxa filosa TaxID=46433 RepID=X6LD03_RETFI|nr:hypothetical protein RFI_38850 [Reticulomyxa filosa]|eukprot:ETN98644.1 hypothetical protein RFI_38850 [Reticulomyxa filosa]